MKILMIVKSLNFGGAEKQVVTDANMLNNAGHQVTVSFVTEGPLSRLLSSDITTYKLKSRLPVFASLQLLFYLIGHRHDVVHAHMFWSEKVSALPAKLTGHKLVFNEHGLGLWRKWYHIAIMRFISLWADRVITSCDATKDIRIQKEKLSEKKVETVYNSLNVEEREEKEGDLPDLLTHDQKFTIGYVGRFSPVKRLKTFITIAEELKKTTKDFRIVMVGDGEDKKELEEDIRARGLSSYFYFPGFVLDTHAYYRIFDIFLLPSEREACSVALLEAATFEIPALAFDVGGNSEIIQDGVTGYIVAEHDIELMLERIVCLYSNKDQKMKMGPAAREFVQRTFSVSRRLDHLIQVYQS